MIPVRIEKPLDQRGYWLVMLHGFVIALCPSEETALKVGTALFKQEAEFGEADDDLG